jgi:acylphosphatase
MAGAGERIELSGQVQELALREQIRDRALGLGLCGWVMLAQDGTLAVHAEGNRDALDAWLAWLRARHEVSEFTHAAVKAEGHEQFAVRGVPAGTFAVRTEGAGQVLELEVDGEMRCWVVPKGISMDPAVKRFAVGAASVPIADRDGAWDRGDYERRGRVAWPEALERGHAMFFLRGEQLTGGFALQRARQGWLLIKRRDEHARRAG